jgi:transposase-like protein
MNVHKNARLTARGRETMISRLERGERPLDVSTAMGVSASTVYKWRRRYRAEGLAGFWTAHRGRTPAPTEPRRVIEDSGYGEAEVARMLNGTATEIFAL